MGAGARTAAPRARGPHGDEGELLTTPHRPAWRHHPLAHASACDPLTALPRGNLAQISLDGYDSETDEWLDCASEAVRPYEAHADSKEAAKQDAAEKEKSRLFAEQRKRDDRRHLSEATNRAA